MPHPHLPVVPGPTAMARTRLASLVAITALVIAACSSSRSVTSGTADAIDTTDSTVPASDSIPGTDASTTTGSTDTVPADTEPDPESTELVLRGSGIGAFDFGRDVASVVDGVSAQLGEPGSITSVEYPLDDGSGLYTTGDGETGYVYPFGRTACWATGWCAEFGGGEPASLFFTGWRYEGETGGALTTAEGVTLGSRWADFTAIEVAEGGCYTVGSGEVAGVRLALLSTGLQFTEFDASGNYVSRIPDPADVTVLSMEAGDVPLFLFGDC